MLVQYYQFHCDGEGCFAAVPMVATRTREEATREARTKGWSNINGEELCPRCQAKLVCAEIGHDWSDVRPAWGQGTELYFPPFRSCQRGCGYSEEQDEIDLNWYPYERHGTKQNR